MPRMALMGLRRDAVRYFLDNQHASGLMLDRQANFGPPRREGLCSLSATGMGLIALALAARAPHRQLTRGEAIERVSLACEAALRLPHTAGVLPHFVRVPGLRVVGVDRRSTVDSAWMIAGALAAAELLGSGQLARLADDLAGRVDWGRFVLPGGVISHGEGEGGRLLGACWDRFNAETLLLYVLAAGSSEAVRLPTQAEEGLGLFVSQYSLEVLDVSEAAPGLLEEAARAVDADVSACREMAGRYPTYQLFWGLSAGDGPGGYQAYAPGGPVDGTAHITATLASYAHRPALVWGNVSRALRGTAPLRGRYGLSNVNLGAGWVSPDVVGIDVGMAALALDNVFCGGRIRQAFRDLPLVRRGMARLGLAAPGREGLVKSRAA